MASRNSVQGPGCKEAERVQRNRKNDLDCNLRSQKAKIVIFVKMIKCFLKESRGGTTQLVSSEVVLVSPALFMTENGLESELPSSVALLLCPRLLTAAVSVTFYIFLE